MATVFRCDRCGKIIEMNDKYNVVYADKEYHNKVMTSLDLCPDCVSKLKNFLENEDTTITGEENAK